MEPLDTRADVLIADHARKNSPPNSFSWRLITESDKAGRLVDKEPHRIGPPPTAPRPFASVAPTRSFRTPYTAADDALLASWVSGYEKKSGNKIYQELEATVSLIPGQCLGAQEGGLDLTVSLAASSTHVALVEGQMGEASQKLAPVRPGPNGYGPRFE